jgi:hypothetical protein
MKTLEILMLTINNSDPTKCMRYAVSKRGLISNCTFFSLQSIRDWTFQVILFQRNGQSCGGRREGILSDMEAAFKISAAIHIIC